MLSTKAALTAASRSSVLRVRARPSSKRAAASEQDDADQRGEREPAQHELAGRVSRNLQDGRRSDHGGVIPHWCSMERPTGCQPPAAKGDRTRRSLVRSGSQLTDGHDRDRDGNRLRVPAHAFVDIAGARRSPEPWLRPPRPWWRPPAGKWERRKQRPVGWRRRAWASRVDFIITFLSVLGGWPGASAQPDCERRATHAGSANHLNTKEIRNTWTFDDGGVGDLPHPLGSLGPFSRKRLRTSATG